MDDSPSRAALIQYLQTDQFFGLRDIPVALGRSTDTAAKAERLPASNRTPHPSGGPRRERLTTTAVLDALRVIDEKRVKPCVKCGLASSRTQTVFGQGNPSARVVFVGEAPGYEEDQQGLAFVGPAGQLLTKMIAAMGLRREDVYICNVLKCRPPNNRTPAADEIGACSPYLYEQLSLIQPEVIVALGAPAAKTLLQSADSIGRLRGRFHDFYLSGLPGAGTPIPLMPTYHPAYLLRTPSDKAKTWADLQQVMQLLGLPPRK